MLRLLPLLLIWLAALASLVMALRYPWFWWPTLILAGLSGLGLWNLLQSRHTLLRNYPLIAYFRWTFEALRPAIRQYLFESEEDGRPFNREQRSLVYRRAKRQNDKIPFGSQLDYYAPGHEWINHSLAALPGAERQPRVQIGGPQCRNPYSASVFNISAMSFGALSANAIRALNQGARLGGFAHDTGEGGISPYHQENGGDLIWEIGSGYFGCRTADGHFNPDMFAERAADPQVRMIELKLSQGAKPGSGGILPASKLTPELARIRAVPMGQDCISPGAHNAFSNPLELLEFIDQLRTLSGGKPTGFKLCIGDPVEFMGIARAMLDTGIRPDFIVIDGAEGGTGAAQLELANRVGMPLREGLIFANNVLVGAGLKQDIRLAASGKIVTGYQLAANMALGADWCNAARGFMFALGCIQALACHTNHCPTGITTQDPLRQKGLVVADKAVRVANFHDQTLKAMASIVAAAGRTHPSELQPEDLLRRTGDLEVRSARELYQFLEPGALLNGAPEPYREWWNAARPDRFNPRIISAA